MKYILTTYVFFALSFVVFAQEGSENALKSFEKKAYHDAASEYNDYITNNKNVSKPILLNAADASFYIREYRQAALYYERAYNFKNKLEHPYLFRYANSLRRLRESDKANALLLNYYKLNNKERFDELSNEIKKQDSISKDPYHVRYDMDNLIINTSNSEFFPVYAGDKLFFTSSGENSKKSTYSWNNQPYLSLFKANILENEMYGEVEKLETEKSVSFHEATLAFHPNDSVVFFSANSRDNSLFKKNENNSFKLYQGIYDGGVIRNVKSLYFNSNFYSVGHPTLSKDGKYLFFASDMPKGYGQADIYYIEIYEDGLLGSVQNAGPLVNTMSNDFFPHLKNDTLYFASDGHLGFGGLDLFQASFSDGEFSNRMNLGKGINTNYDEFSMFYKDSISGFFASNRPMGQGDDDIYSFKENRDSTCVTYYKVNVIDRVTKEPIPGVSLRLIDLEKSKQLFTLTTNDTGMTEFDLPCNIDFAAIASKNEFLELEFDKNEFSGEENLKDITVQLYNPNSLFEDTSDNQKKLKLPPIHFNLGSWKITEKGASVLDKVVQVLNAFPDMVIKIESHTDSRDSDKSNLILSSKRAIATRDYLFAQGVDEARIVDAVGYGEFKLLNKCEDGVSCSEEMHQENRRSDFIIVNEVE